MTVDIRDDTTVHAPAARVWHAIKDPAVHAAWHPFVTRIDGQHERGATRHCVIRIGKNDGSTEEYVTEYEDERRLLWRIRSDSTGFSRMVTDWTAGFVLRPSGPHDTVVTAVSIFRPRNWMIRLMLPLIRRKFHQTQRAILGGLVTHLHGTAATSARHS